MTQEEITTTTTGEKVETQPASETPIHKEESRVDGSDEKDTNDGEASSNPAAENDEKSSSPFANIASSLSPIDDTHSTSVTSSIPTASQTQISQEQLTLTTAESTFVVPSHMAEVVAPIVVAEKLDEEAGKAASDKKKKRPRDTIHSSRTLVLWIVVLSIIGVTLAIVLPVTLNRNDTDTSTTNNPTNSSTQTNNSDSFSKPPQQNENNNDSVELEKRRSEMIEFLGGLPLGGISDPIEAINDRNAALEWIVAKDSLQLPIPDRKVWNITDDPSVFRLQQRYLLTLLYYATNGPEWDDQYNFLMGVDECRWSSAWTKSEEDWFFDNTTTGAKGVICGSDELNDRVYQLKLWWNKLEGTIPEELSYFSDTLVEFNIVGNSVKGQFPTMMTNFSQLSALGLAGNCFTGTIPNTLQSMEIFTIYNNQFTSGNVNDAFCGTNNTTGEPILRENVVAVAVDSSIDCECCIVCNPNEYECTNVLYNATYMVTNVGGEEPWDKTTGYLKQFERPCLTKEQREWIPTHCPCVVDNVCSTNCTGDGARQSVSWVAI